MSIRNIATFCLAGSFTILNACTGAFIDFERMSATDLIAYNRGVEFWDQIYCTYEVRAGSHIRRRHCNTLIEIREGLTKSADAINVLGSSRTF